jgi:mannose-6-phosphate isomerase
MIENLVGYPLKLRPTLVPKVWGGRRLEQIYGHKQPGRDPIGEAWVAWDGLTVTNGHWAGATVAELTARAPALVFERTPTTPAEAAFPLLAKFLDARENLSIQVHPDDKYARQREGQPYGKCEMWYVLEAQPGAAVIQGVTRGLSREQLTASARDGSIADFLDIVPVKPGDVLINLPGTIHALCAGVVIYELQQSCDVTYRLYDWGRGGASGRALHLDQSADVAWLEPMTQHLLDPVVSFDGPYRASFLAACRYFAAELLELPADFRLRREANQLRILTAIEGRVGISHSGTRGGPLVLRPGESALIPRGLAKYSARAIDGPCRFVDGYVPDLARDVVRPLLAAAVPADRIVRLGGEPERSDLRAVVEAAL